MTRTSAIVVAAILLTAAFVVFPKTTLSILASMAFMAIAAAAWLYGRLYRSRPLLKGKLEIAEIKAQVTLERDSLGIPTITGRSRADVAFGLGFLHAQERFFQMDMSRRAAAGELAELLGELFISADRKARLHQFRQRAIRRLATLSANERELLESYTAGVQSGLQALHAAPFEYLALRSKPVAWRDEDTILIVFHLYRLLQENGSDQDFNRYLLYTALPAPIADFLAPEGSPDWDAPLVGPPSQAMRVPGAEVFDFRNAAPSRIPGLQLRPALVPGSNAWAISGAHTKTGKALVANDMHLFFDMPSYFYRATLCITEENPAGHLSGVTIPGFPFLLAGTNGRIAWGLANAAVKAVDLVALDQAGLPTGAYRTSNDVRRFESECEIIRVRGKPDLELTISRTVWGPVVRKTRDGIAFAQRWLAYDAEAVNLAWQELEKASSVVEAMNAANRIRTPALSVVVGDIGGDVGWTLAGLLPWGKKRPFSAISSEVTAKASDHIPHIPYPRLQSPEFSRVWAANARCITQGEAGQLLQRGYHVCGARASQIRNVLLELKSADEESFLRIQCDDRAFFMARWHALLLRILQSGNLTDHTRLAEVCAELKGWNGRAAADSVAYRLVRKFRDIVERLVFEPFIFIVRARHRQFDLSAVTDQLETPLWQLITERPAHLLPPWFTDWDSLMTAAAGEVLGGVPDQLPLRAFVWGAVNKLSMRHPLSSAMPIMARWFDAPSSELDGDLHMPLAQTSRHGPVFRFVISPGRLPDAIAQMAGGQAANPLAPYYLAGHEDWLKGRRAPLSSGPARYKLTLNPLVPD
jgi:penicillin G amidase